MAEISTWQSAFVATTFAIGGSLDDAAASLGAPDRAAAGAVFQALAHPRREVRVRALAAALGRIAADLEPMRIA